MRHKIYWGDTHTNTHLRHLDQIDGIFEEAARILDFLAIAYYPFERDDVNGIHVESWGQRPHFLAGWDVICRTVAAHNAPGKFVTFPGYEWHGDRTRWGDHNVFYNGDSAPLLATETVADLFNELRKLGGIAIPHHTAYRVGMRGKDWSVFDEQICPFAELYSAHGSSEAIDVRPGMTENGDMGPRVSGGTIQDGLARGLRFGIIASNESHVGYAGRWGYGLMAVLADDLTRDSLWEAFLARRVYGVTGDRIALQFSANGHEMGECFRTDGPVEFCAGVSGSGALDRIELLKNNRVFSTHCHRDTWDEPTGGAVRAKWRIGGLCGPSAHMNFRDLGPHPMDLALTVQGGRILTAEPCFSAPGQRLGEVNGDRLSWHWSIPPRVQNDTPNMQAVVVEFEADRGGRLMVEIDGRHHELTVGEALGGASVLPLLEESRERIWKTFGCSAEDIKNPDEYYHNAHKVLFSRADPEAACRANVTVVDESPGPGRNWYYVRVTQENGQMAWSSPIWVECGP